MDSARERLERRIVETVQFNAMSEIVEHRVPDMLSDGTLSKIPDNELHILERHLFGVVQSIRRIRGLPPYETTKHRRQVAGE